MRRSFLPRRPGVAIALAVLGTTACRPASRTKLEPAGEPPAAHAEPLAEDDARIEDAPIDGPRISIRRTACLGHCPDYTLTLRPSGRVDFTGRVFVATVGHAQDRVDPGQARALFERLEAIEFFELESCVDKLDVPQLIVTAEHEGRAHEVAAIRSCPGRGLGALFELAQDLEQLAGGERWVGHVVPCGFALGEVLYFPDGQQQLPPRGAEVLAEVATVLRDVEVPVMLVGTRRADEPPDHALRRAESARDALVQAGVAGDRLAVEAAASVSSSIPEVRFRVEVPPCEPDQRWPWVTVPGVER